jgi:uncharacterized oxidoreductase
MDRAAARLRYHRFEDAARRSMNFHQNTMLITGGGSGIGRGLAESFHLFGNQVIVAGRRENLLRELCAANSGMKYFVFDVADARSIRDLASSVVRDFPALNCVINNAGVQYRGVNFAAGSFDDAAMLNEVQTNLIGLIRMCAAFVPQLKGKQDATLVNVSSGLAFVPRAFIPIYSATKAAVHSFTLSLRWQLRAEKIQVVELIPPWVKTDLGGSSPVPARPSEASSAPSQPVQPMPLAEFTQAAVQGLLAGLDEVTVGHATSLATAGGLETEKAVFARING